VNHLRTFERVVGVLFYLAFLAVIAKLSWAHRGLVLSIPAAVVAVALLTLFLLVSLRRGVRADAGRPAERNSNRTASLQRIALFAVGIVVAVSLLANITPPSVATMVAILAAAGIPILATMLTRKRDVAP
jgi:hypothetical protein